MCDARSLQAIDLITPKYGPDDQVPVPSKGNNNPAVMKYDPTGLRSTMSANNKAWEESLKVGNGTVLLSLPHA